MSACSQCGTVVKPGDKFCNVCGTPIRPNVGGGPTGGQAQPAAPTYGSPGGGPPPMPFGAPTAASPGVGGYGAPPAPQAARCQLGHEIAPGASYCSQGHPIALEQMQFANDPYGLNNYGQPPPPPGMQGGGRPPSAYGTPPPPGYGTPPPPPYNAPPPQAAYASAYGAPMPQPGGSGPPGAYAPPPQPYGAPAPAPPAPGYTAEPPAKVLRGFLIAYGTNPSGDFWPLTGGRLTVGRFGTGDGLDIPLQDPTISSRHATMVIDAPTGMVNVEDTGSTNGTFVNDEHIGYGGRRELRDGDRIRFGGFTTIVKVIGRV